LSFFFEDLGIGVGLRPPHFDRFLEQCPNSVSWVEVISENYMDWRSMPVGRPVQMLEKIRKNVPVVLHGVSLSIGSADPLDLTYLKKLKELSDRIRPQWISDHLCWTGLEGSNIHDLLPLPYTQEVLDHVVQRIQRVQEFLGQRVLIENPSSYFEFEVSEMSEWEFLKEMSQRADCGLLLDINNVYVSSVNHRFNPKEYLQALPQCRVGQIHLAGHANKGEYLIDTHDTPVCAEVWSLYEWYVEKFGLVSTMLERDGNIPDWEEMERELQLISTMRKNPSRNEKHQLGQSTADL